MNGGPTRARPGRAWPWCIALVVIVFGYTLCRRGIVLSDEGYLLLGAEEPVRVWVSPGPWTRPDASGHFALTDLSPGHYTLRAWHPRLPSASAPVDLQAGATATVNFEIGVGRGEGAHEAH